MSYFYVLQKTLQSYCAYSSRNLAPLASFDESIAEQILVLGQSLCTLQSQTFISEESHASILQAIASLDALCKSHFDCRFDDEWRFVIGMAVTFYEWCVDVEFFSLSTEDEKNRLLPESPLSSFHCFTLRF